MNGRLKACLSGLLSIPVLAACSPEEKCSSGDWTGNTQEWTEELAKGNRMEAEATYPEITRTELSERIATGDITLVDANGSDSFAEGHIPGALDFEAMAAEFPQGLPKDKHAVLVAYCGGPRCGAWKAAAKALTAQGYSRVFHYPGGLLEWTEMGMPLETGAVSAKDRKISLGGDKALIPGCKLSPKAQAERLKSLRTQLFQAIEAVVEGPGGSMRLQFKDTPDNVAELTGFIRFERECCTSLRFGLLWEPEGGPVTLEMKGPEALLAALKEISAQ